MTTRIQVKRGLRANLPSSSMLAGEPMFTTDRGTLHVAVDSGTSLPVVPPIDELVTLAAVDGSADLVLIHDASETGGQKEKKMTFAEFKAALNIPTGASDEMVAVVAGGTSGFIWGTDGTDGIIRLNNSLSWTKDSGNGFVTIAVDLVDCGTF